MVPPSTELLPSAAPSSVHHFVATPDVLFGVRRHAAADHAPVRAGGQSAGAGPKRHDPEQDPEGGRGGEGDGAQGMAAFLLDVPAQGTLRENREAADGSEAKGLSGMSVADGRTGARWRAAGRGQAGVRPDCAPGGQQACQEGHSSLDLGLAASWNGFRRPGWRQISGIRPHLGPIGDRCSSGWAPCAALVRYPG